MSTQLISVVVVDGEPRIDSRIIARELGIEHETTQRLINKYSEHFQAFSQLRFENGVVNGHQGGGNPQKYALLNEDQTYFLMTLVRNTVQSVGLKKRLVQAFSECRNTVFALTGHPFRPVVETISPCQRMSLQRLVANIGDCFHMDGAGHWAGYALIRAEFGVQNTKDLQPEHYAGAVSLLQAAWQQSMRFKGRVMETERRFLRNRFRYHPADFERLEAAASASELTFRP